MMRERIAPKKIQCSIFIYEWLDSGFKKFLSQQMMARGKRITLYKFANQFLDSDKGKFKAEEVLLDFEEQLLGTSIHNGYNEDDYSQDVASFTVSINRESHPSLSVFYKNADQGFKGIAILSAFYVVYDAVINEVVYPPKIQIHEDETSSECENQDWEDFETDDVGF